ncbi:type II toxin-antitoxin system HipA family toxin [Runella rosea]|uniref:Type II toxin-antitoxin system HipA family toxin n=1 Tax=Runella rosea TaxID=2259595 RepID=A0A344TGT4_9BACT|nr:HipA domain-containing protein [Runella rosea]AXE17855.1 type II toxin-antitoxin system HipA family toxin [Runella rosea]
MKRCLYCYQLLGPTETDFHASCSKKIFGNATPPALPYTENQMEELATQVIRSQMTVTGVQPKLSLEIVSGKKKTESQRFTIVGLWGGYILKPPTPHYPQLPEVEDLTMHLAEIAGIRTVPHSLIRLQSGSLAYITKRIDRVKKNKLPMEDMCQLTERLTEDKYHGSYEQIAKTILKYSTNPGLDTVNFFEQVLFSFLTGNADMHLKNFSLITQPSLGPILSPAYDMVATALVNPADNEDMALTLNGKKRKLKRSDFTTAFTTLKLEVKQQENIFKKMEKVKEKWMEYIAISFLSPDFKEAFIQLIQERFSRLKA